MDAYNEYLNSLFNRNRDIYGGFENIRWANPYNTTEARKRRDELLTNIGNNSLFKQTKPYYGFISEGCNLCGMGQWSCIFITGTCNASCFYCPARQDYDEIPSSQKLIFESPEIYADYVNYMGFKGVSFSGGEPLLQFDRVLSYLDSLRKKSDPHIYTWLYTNGVIGNQHMYTRLAKTGLNEIRFNIGATNYSIDKLRKASGLIPVITVEIPAIPEEKDLIIKLLPWLIKAGVSNLNLHQLRLTSHNAPNIIKRGYTLIPAEKPVVMESELTALEIINDTLRKKLDIGINYCSFLFKYRFQKAGFRKKTAMAIKIPEEMITENGFIREAGDDFIKYSGVLITENTQSPFPAGSHVIKMESKCYMVHRLTALHYNNLSKEKMKEINDQITSEPSVIPCDIILFDAWQHEYIERGLREY